MTINLRGTRPGLLSPPVSLLANIYGNLLETASDSRALRHLVLLEDTSQTLVKVCMLLKSETK
ncbi:hypothetical protein EYF80_021259 [Liparis tanakae]|uniref:Uncharacterized protein n=1 Tax=Liparis tanakae TaxID=230148 RepID=A0A4Z2HTZ8_9TELE|nr:hypothetical protein EYF80_021259 [Liparis tanakae]